MYRGTKSYTVANYMETLTDPIVKRPATGDDNDDFLSLMWLRQVSINYLVTDRH